MTPAPLAALWVVVAVAAVLTVAASGFLILAPQTHPPGKAVPAIPMALSDGSARP